MIAWLSRIAHLWISLLKSKANISQVLSMNFRFLWRAALPLLRVWLWLWLWLRLWLCVYNNFPNMHMCVYVHLHISDMGRYVNRCPWTQYASILQMTSMRSQFLQLLKYFLKCCHEMCNGMTDHSMDVFIGIQWKLF